MAAIQAESAGVRQAAKECMAAARRTALTIKDTVTHPGLRHIPRRPLSEYSGNLRYQTVTPDRKAMILDDSHLTLAEVSIGMAILATNSAGALSAERNMLWVDMPTPGIFQIGVVYTDPSAALDVGKYMQARQLRIIDGIPGMQPDVVFSEQYSSRRWTSLSAMRTEGNALGLSHLSTVLLQTSDHLDRYIRDNMKRGWNHLPPVGNY